MAKNWGRLVLFAAAAGAAAAGTYYYLQKHKKAADPECEAYDGDAAADDDFEDDDFFDDDFEDEEEDCEKKDTSRIFTAGTNAQGHTYVTLDLKAASDKAANLCDNVATKFGEAVQKLKNSSEYEAVSGKVSETVDKIKNSEEFQAVDEQVENALRVLDWIGETFPPGTVLLSLLRQYTPMPQVMNMPPMNRTVSDEEYEAVLSWVYLNKLEGYTQGAGSASSAYIPDFSPRPE